MSSNSRMALNPELAKALLPQSGEYLPGARITYNQPTLQLVGEILKVARKRPDVKIVCTFMDPEDPTELDSQVIVFPFALNGDLDKMIDLQTTMSRASDVTVVDPSGDETSPDQIVRGDVALSWPVQRVRIN